MSGLFFEENAKETTGGLIGTEMNTVLKGVYGIEVESSGEVRKRGIQVARLEGILQGMISEMARQRVVGREELDA